MIVITPVHLCAYYIPGIVLSASILRASSEIETVNTHFTYEKIEAERLVNHLRSHI